MSTKRAYAKSILFVSKSNIWLPRHSTKAVIWKLECPLDDHRGWLYILKITVKIIVKTKNFVLLHFYFQ